MNGTHKGFFRIDRRTWAQVCSLGMNPACAYLVLACGTGRDNRTTAWSATAVTEYSGIAWLRAKPAIQKLCKSGFINQTKGGTKPRYELLNCIEIEQARTPEPTGDYRRLYEDIAKGRQPGTDWERKQAEELFSRGRLWFYDGGYQTEPLSEDTSDSEHWIWLPKTLVMGTRKGERSPVTRVRQAQDVLALRLLIDLYHAQNLRDDGGISRGAIYQQFERTQIGEQGIYVVWCFAPSKYFASQHPVTLPHWSKQPDGTLMLWKRLHLLEAQGLIEFIPHLCESSAVDAEIIHPYGTNWSESGLSHSENVLGYAAYDSAVVMSKPNCNLPSGYYAPVERSFPDVQMIGIARLRYRPQTRCTAQWWALLQSKTPGLLAKYEELRSKAEVIAFRASSVRDNRR